jgi:hypothetical protein
MSAAQISDLELDGLLGAVSPPQPPSADLADRIAERALRTPQERARRFAFAPRHGPRMRATLWTAVIAANLMTAAAAAASWDGQRFDFHRLADLPNRVALAVHIGHHHREGALVARRNVAPVAHIAGLVRTASAIQPVEPSRAEARAARARPVVMPPIRVRSHLANPPVERPQPIERGTAAAQPAKRVHPFQHRVAVPPHRVPRLAPRKRLEAPVSAVSERSQLKVPDALPRQEYLEQRPATVERQQVAPQVPVSAVPREGVGQHQTRPDGEVSRNEEYRRRLERWRNQFHQRERPRERGHRFRRRF